MCHKNLHSKCDKLKSLHSYSNYNGRFPFDISLCLFHKSRIFYNKHFTYFVYYFTSLLKMLRRKKTNHCWVFYTETLVTQSCPTLWDPMNCRPSGSSLHGDSPGKNTGMGCHDLQGIFLTQVSYGGFPHYRQILYRLSYHVLQHVLTIRLLVFIDNYTVTTFFIKNF